MCTSDTGIDVCADANASITRKRTLSPGCASRRRSGIPLNSAAPSEGPSAAKPKLDSHEVDLPAAACSMPPMRRPASIASSIARRAVADEDQSVESPGPVSELN